jgi:hypothetical protein
MFKLNIDLQRFLIAAMYSISCLIFLLVGSHLDKIQHLVSDEVIDTLNIQYYIGAGALDVIMVNVMLYFARRTRFTDLMVGVCAIDFLLNLAGFIMYEKYNSGVAYKIAFDMLYLAVIFIFLIKDKGHEHNGSYSFWMPYRKTSIGSYSVSTEKETC